MLYNKTIFNVLASNELQIQSKNFLGFGIGKVDMINGQIALPYQLKNLSGKKISFVVKQQLARFTFLIDIVSIKEN